MQLVVGLIFSLTSEREGASTAYCQHQLVGFLVLNRSFSEGLVFKGIYFLLQINTRFVLNLVDVRKTLDVVAIIL